MTKDTAIKLFNQKQVRCHWDSEPEKWYFSIVDVLEVLTLLIEKWDSEHSTLTEKNPVELLHSLMHDHNLKAKDLVPIMGVSKGLVSDILNFKKGLSKEIIRILAGYFKVSQEAFNRPYKLINPANSHLRNASVMNTRKKVELV